MRYFLAILFGLALLMPASSEAQHVGRLTTGGLGVSATALTTDAFAQKAYGVGLGYVLGSRYEVGGQFGRSDYFRRPLYDPFYTANVHASFYPIRQGEAGPISLSLGAKYAWQWSTSRHTTGHGPTVSGALFRSIDLAPALQLIPQFELGYRIFRYPYRRENARFPRREVDTLKRQFVAELAGSFLYEVSPAGKVALTPFVQRQKEYRLGMSASFVLSSKQLKAVF